MSIPGKMGSSRRKGDEYQDFTALCFALENYIIGNPFKMFLEYENSGNLDDIVIFKGNNIYAYQVKYAINPLEVYQVSDFTDEKSLVCLKKFADSWNLLRSKYPNNELTILICSNRGLDASLVDLVNSDGKFKQEVIDNRKRKNAKIVRKKLFSATGLNTDDFSAFLSSFQFDVRRPVLSKLQQYIKATLLDSKLGISDNNLFHTLKDIIKDNAIFSREPITDNDFNDIVLRYQSKMILPQVFPIDTKLFVERKSLSIQLNEALSQKNVGYVIVTGLPGSGKSTSLTTYFDELEQRQYEVFKYYCFVNINDNSQRTRIKSESFCANLLNEFHKRYPYLLGRRHDYSEKCFNEALSTLTNYFLKEKKRFIIFVDGLDHVELLSLEDRENVISALPVDLPEGLSIVIGSQELSKWPHFLKKVRDNPKCHIIMPLFSELETKDYLINKKGISDLSPFELTTIHKKSEGLPLYLQYLSEILSVSEDRSMAISSIAPANNGNICNYYNLLWEKFEQENTVNAKHLCVVMACMRFGLYRKEFHNISKLTRPIFEGAYKQINHLLRDYDGQITIFHNSFREFILGQVSDDWIKEIKEDICSFLRKEKNSPRWFSHIFQYSLEVDNYNYILEEIDNEFIEAALLHYRPREELLESINLAIKVAYQEQNIVQLGRLGSLKYITDERLEHNLDRSLLADAILAMGNEQDVISFAFSNEANRWLVDQHVALSIMINMAKQGKFKLGEKLFDIFISSFRGFDSEDDREMKSKIISIAHCLGIYTKKQARPLKWLSQFKFTLDSLEKQELYAPKYAPHLAAYIDALVQYSHVDKWERLKRLNQLFDNDLVQYLIIRSLANHNHFEELKVAIIEYSEKYKPKDNIELAFYAAMAGMPKNNIIKIAGQLEAPKTEVPGYISPSDPMLMNYVYSFIVMSYENNSASYSKLIDIVGEKRTLWNSNLRYLLKICNCIGQAFLHRDKILLTNKDWFEEACGSIDILVNAEQGDRERIYDSIDHIRGILPETIGLMTDQIQLYAPEKIDDWINKLELLRDSLLWNVHFGINEYIRDYMFELKLWNHLAKNFRVGIKLINILNDCANTYTKCTNLKGDSRSKHFISLSQIMAKCGINDKAVLWLRYGIHASLIYGYHKDITLLYLMQVLEIVNKQTPRLALERCARVLEMVKWMPQLTDGRETKWFPMIAFDAVLNVNHQAAFDLLRHFSKNISRWKMQKCLKKYIMSLTHGNIEYLWCLSELFLNFDTEDGAFANQIIEVREHIVKLAKNIGQGRQYQEIKEKLRVFIITDISPRHWPEDIRKELNIPFEIHAKENQIIPEETKKDFILDGKNITKEKIIEKGIISFTAFLTIIEKLNNQKSFFYEPDIMNTVLEHHITSAKSSADLVPIKKFIEDQGRSYNGHTIAKLSSRYLDLGDKDNAMVCLGMAYECYGKSFFAWQDNAKYLCDLASIDKQEAYNVGVRSCHNSCHGDFGGFDTATKAASIADILGEYQMVEDIFNDYLLHCESMFTQLPDEREFDWLKNYQAPSKNENKLILDFVIDELFNLEVDFGERLIKALSHLAVKDPDEVIPEIISRVMFADGKIQRRLISILHCIAYKSPELLADYQCQLAKLFEHENFYIRKSILDICVLISNVVSLEYSLSKKIQNIMMEYLNIIHNSTYKTQATPTPEFTSFVGKLPLVISGKISAIERILQLSQGCLWGTIENRLYQQKWSISEEQERLKNNWDGHIHPQGWPLIPIETDIQEMIFKLLGDILNEIITKLPLSIEQIDFIWQTVQVIDPQYVVDGVRPRPYDIKPLYVEDKDMWFTELHKYDSMQIASTHYDKGDWITIYEKREMVQEKTYDTPYKQFLTLSGFLIPKNIYKNAQELDNFEQYSERFSPDPSMSITLEQAKLILKERENSLFDPNNESQILIATHKNPFFFNGYQNICFLASYLIDQFHLSFTGNNLTRNSNILAKFESWQEGYQSDAYTREKLSSGVRLQIHSSLMKEICAFYDKILCIRTNEMREFYKSSNKKQPDENQQTRRYKLYHF